MLDHGSVGKRFDLGIGSANGFGQFDLIFVSKVLNIFGTLDLMSCAALAPGSGDRGEVNASAELSIQDRLMHEGVGRDFRDGLGEESGKEREGSDIDRRGEGAKGRRCFTQVGHVYEEFFTNVVRDL